MNDILHTIIDVLAGRRNLAPHEADAMHETLTPGYGASPPSDADVAAAQALLARARETAPDPTTDSVTTSVVSGSAPDASSQSGAANTAAPTAPEGSAS